MCNRHAGKMNITKVCVFILMLVLSANVLCACSGDGKKGNNTGVRGNSSPAASTSKQSQDDFNAYIKNALENVKQNSVSTDTAAEPEDNGQVIFVNTEEDDDAQVYVSASDELSDRIPLTSDSEDIDDDEEVPDMALEPETDVLENDSTGEATEDDGLTPDDFPVGTSCIYIRGETDAGYAKKLIEALNKARTDLGFEPLTEKTGLDKCADRRTREITCFLSHTRPNGQYFTSVAPQYFRAEMLAIDNATEEETIDAWIADPVSRELLFNTTYTSVGASSFKCNGYISSVVAFGY